MADITRDSLGKDIMSKVWFVTGSSRGLGRSFVEAALSRGDRAAATARNPEQLDELVAAYVLDRRPDRHADRRRVPALKVGTGSHE